MPGGSIIFYPQEGRNVAPVTATIKADGTYDAPEVPVGPAKVAVSNAELDPNADDPLNPTGTKSAAAEKMPAFVKSKMQGMGPPKEALQGKDIPKAEKKVAGTYIPIDPKFTKPEMSGLSLDVKPGDQTYDATGIVATGKKAKSPS